VFSSATVAYVHHRHDVAYATDVQLYLALELTSKCLEAYQGPLMNLLHVSSVKTCSSLSSHWSTLHFTATSSIIDKRCTSSYSKHSYATVDNRPQQDQQLAELDARVSNLHVTETCNRLRTETILC